MKYLAEFRDVLKTSAGDSDKMRLRRITAVGNIAEAVMDNPPIDIASYRRTRSVVAQSVDAMLADTTPERQAPLIVAYKMMNVATHVFDRASKFVSPKERLEDAVALAQFWQRLQESRPVPSNTLELARLRAVETAIKVGSEPYFAGKSNLLLHLAAPLIPVARTPRKYKVSESLGKFLLAGLTAKDMSLSGDQRMGHLRQIASLPHGGGIAPQIAEAAADILESKDLKRPFAERVLLAETAIRFDYTHHRKTIGRLATLWAEACEGWARQAPAERETIKDKLRRNISSGINGNEFLAAAETAYWRVNSPRTAAFLEALHIVPKVRASAVHNLLKEEKRVARYRMRHEAMLGPK